METNEKIKQINKLYPYLTKDDINLLDNIAVFDTLPSKKVLIEYKKVCFDFIYIYKGSIRGYYFTEKGEERTVFIGNDDLFIGAPESILHKKPTKYYFETVVKTEFYKFDFRKLEEIAVLNSNIFKFYTDILKKILSLFIDRIESFIGSNPEERYLDLHEKRPLIISYAHKKQIATFLGISPNSLSRIISRINKDS